MEEKAVRLLANDLCGTKTTPVQRAAALRTLRVQIKSKTNITEILPKVAEVANDFSSGAEARTQATECIAAFLAEPSLRERCSWFEELLSALWTSYLEAATEGQAEAALHGFAALGTEDFARFVKEKNPEELVAKVLAHSSPVARVNGAFVFGRALVKVWPATLGTTSEMFRERVLDALRMILGQIAHPTGEENAIRVAASEVLDATLSAYLAVEPAGYAPLALLHPLWRTSSPYASLVHELQGTMRASLPVLLEKGAGLITKQCIWLASGASEQYDEISVSFSEASAFRAALVWFLTSKGGVEGGVSEQSNVVGLIKELKAGRRPTPQTRGGIKPLTAPPQLQAALEQVAAQGRSMSATAAVQGATRAHVVLALLALATLAPTAGDQLLQHGEQACEAALGKAPAATLFCAEVVGSLLALWPMVAEPHGPSAARFLRVAVRVLVEGSSVAPATPGAEPNRVVTLLCLLAKATVGVLLALQQAAGRSSVSLLTEALGSYRLPPLASMLLCNSCMEATSFRSTTSSRLDAWIPIAIDLVKFGCPQDFRSFADKNLDLRGILLAATWCLLALFRNVVAASTGRAAIDAASMLRSLLDAVGAVFPGGVPLAKQCPGLMASTIGVLADTGTLAALASGRPAVQEALATWTRGLPEELEEYARSAPSFARTPGQVGSPGHAALLTESEGALQTLLWLHVASGDSEPTAYAKNPRWLTKANVGGPPVMVELTVTRMYAEKGACRVLLKVDMHNVMPLTLRNIRVRFGISWPPKPDVPSLGVGPGLEGENVREGQQADTMPGRTTLTFLHPMRLPSMRPTVVVVQYSHDNEAPAGRGHPDERGEKNEDEWSEDDDEEVLNFSCMPLALPASTFFRPFRGFDVPASSVYPPPSIFTACRHVQHEQVVGGPLALDTFEVEKWRPPGFHRLVRDGCNAIVGDVVECFAGLHYDAEALLCILLRGQGQTARLEMRSNNEKILRDFAATLYFWLLHGFAEAEEGFDETM